MKKAGVIGGSEFIGCYITLKFLAENYIVRMQVPLLSRKENIFSLQALTAHQNLEVSRTNPGKRDDILRFVRDCETIIHCGIPYKLGVNNAAAPIYVPVIQNSGSLLNVLRDAPCVKKIIFISSALPFIPREKKSARPKKNPSGENPSSQKALFHTERTVSKILNDLNDKQIEVITMAPVEVKKGLLTNSREATALGLQFLFRNNIPIDPYFQKIAHQKPFNTMCDVNNLPDVVFRAANNKFL